MLPIPHRGGWSDAIGSYPVWDAWTRHVQLNMRIEDAMEFRASMCQAICRGCSKSFSSQTLRADEFGYLWHERCYQERDRHSLTLYPLSRYPMEFQLGNAVNIQVEKSGEDFVLHVKNQRMNRSNG